MPSRHTTVEITSAEIKSISLALEQARDVMCDWQRLHKENVGDWRDTFKLPAEERYAAMVKQWDGWDAPEGQMRALVGVLDALDAVKVMERQLWKQHGRKQPGEKIMAVEKNPTNAERREIVRELVSGLDDFGRKAQHQPTVAELREHGKHEPAWVQEASAYHRSRDPGEFSDERRGQMDRVRHDQEPKLFVQAFGRVLSVAQAAEYDKQIERGVVPTYESVGGRYAGVVAPAKEHAKPEAARELERDDGYAKAAETEAMGETWARQAEAKAARLEQERNPLPYVLETKDKLYYEAFSDLGKAAEKYASMEERSGKVLKDSEGRVLADHHFDKGGWPGYDSFATPDVRHAVIHAGYEKVELGDDDHEMGM